MTSAAENGVTMTHTYDANGNRTSTAVSAQNTKTEYTFNRANLVTSAEHKQLVNDAWVTLSSEACTYEEIQNESWKFTTNNFGMTVRIRK